MTSQRHIPSCSPILAAALNAAAGEQVARALCMELTLGGVLPSRVPLLPKPDAAGRITGEDGRSWTVPSFTALQSAFSKSIPIDINHSTELAAKAGGESPAAAWINSLSLGDDGVIYGAVAWTPRGEAAVANRDYRYISPVFVHRADGTIVRFTSAALTNTPNFPLALNRANPSNEPRNEDRPMWKALLAALGLAETATETDAITAVNALKTERQTALNAAEHPPLSKYVPRADYDAVVTASNAVQTELQGLKDKGRDAEITAEVDAAQRAGKITPATRDYHMAMCRREGGLEEFRKFIAVAPVVVDPKESGAGKHAEKEATGGALTEHQKAMCTRMGLAEKDYQAALATAA